MLRGHAFHIVPIHLRISAAHMAELSDTGSDISRRGLCLARRGIAGVLRLVEYCIRAAVGDVRYL